MSTAALLEWSGPSDIVRTLGTVEAAYVKAAEQQYGSEFTFWARTDGAGRVEVAQVLKIVADVEDEHREVKLADVIAQVPNAKLGAYVVNRIDPIEPNKADLKHAHTLATVKNMRISLT